MLTHLRSWVVIIVLALAAFTACAQTPASPAAAPASTVAPAALLRPSEVPGSYNAYLAQRYAGDKEARAAMHLFGRKRTGGGLWLASGAAVITFIASQTGTTTTSSGTTTVKVTPLGYGILLGLFGGVGIGKLARFSNEKLFEALLAHEQGGGFPGYVTSRLQDKDYK